MDGIQFEYYLRELYKSQGYRVEVTKVSGDYGADLILNKDGKKIVVQAKRYSKNVGIEAIQQVVGAISYYRANEAWVVTNRDYTQAAYNLASSNQVKLINRDAFIDMVLSMNQEAIPSPTNVKLNSPSENVKCNKCGSHMVVRDSARGQFFGCASFPKCRNIKPV
jgi:restriction system protein